MKWTPWAALLTAYFAWTAPVAAASAESEPLHHYGVAVLKDSRAETEFAARFNAQGRPLFLIGDLARGVAIGDIIRFRDKAVLINEEVWQTMKATGVLDGIRGAQVAALSAKASSGIWKSRAEIAEGREKTGYALGAEFINILEDYFGSVPDRMEITFRFDGDRMTVLAPTEVLGILNFTARNEKGKQVSAPANSQPRIISEPPRRAFAGETFAWTVWAVDPGYPSAALSYAPISKLPPGINWDAERHALTGRPTRPGAYEIKVRASNAVKRADELGFTLAIAANQKPRIWGEPERAPAADGSWRFQPIIADPDHLSSELKVEATALPPGLAFDAAARAFVCKGCDRADFARLRFSLKATDPLGASEERTFDMAAPADGMLFRSALNSPDLQQGQVSYYAPVATGPGRDVRYAANDGGGTLAVEDGRLALATDVTGVHVLEVTARDELGNQARQLLSYQVSPRPGMMQSAEFAARGTGSGSLLAEARYRLGRSRVGLLHAGAWDTNPPFLFFGFNPIPEAAAGRHSLFLDLGFNAQGKSGITYGGFMAGLDGRYGRFGEDGLVFRYRAHYHARQGIVLMDAQDYRQNDLGNTRLEKCLQDLRSRTDRTDSLVAGFLACDDGARKLVDAYGSGTNEVFLLESALWIHLGYGAYGGPLYRIEDHVHSHGRFDQRIGLGLARSAHYGWVGADASAGVAFSPGSPAAEFLFDFTLRFGHDD